MGWIKKYKDGFIISDPLFHQFLVDTPMLG